MPIVRTSSPVTTIQDALDVDQDLVQLVDGYLSIVVDGETLKIMPIVMNNILEGHEKYSFKIVPAGTKTIQPMGLDFIKGLAINCDGIISLAMGVNVVTGKNFYFNDIYSLDSIILTYLYQILANGQIEAAETEEIEVEEKPVTAVKLTDPEANYNYSKLVGIPVDNTIDSIFTFTITQGLVDGGKDVFYIPIDMAPVDGSGKVSATSIAEEINTIIETYSGAVVPLVVRYEDDEASDDYHKFIITSNREGSYNIAVTGDYDGPDILGLRSGTLTYGTVNELTAVKILTGDQAGNSFDVYQAEGPYIYIPYVSSEVTAALVDAKYIGISDEEDISVQVFMFM